MRVWDPATGDNSSGWRLCAGGQDYVAALTPGRLPLIGAPVEPAWDAELGAAMRHHGVAVHEEAVLEKLLAACHA